LDIITFRELDEYFITDDGYWQEENCGQGDGQGECANPQSER
jgi:hypothetical protein